MGVETKKTPPTLRVICGSGLSSKKVFYRYFITFRTANYVLLLNYYYGLVYVWMLIFTTLHDHIIVSVINNNN